jgi:hypothetical protein
MFRALFAQPQEALQSDTWHISCELSVGCTGIEVELNPGAANLHNTHAIYQVSLVKGLLRMSK